MYKKSNIFHHLKYYCLYKYFKYYLPGLGEGFKCSSMALSNNFFLSLTDIFTRGGVGDVVGESYIVKHHINLL